MPSKQEDDIDLRPAYVMALAISIGELAQEVKMLRFALHRHINHEDERKKEEGSWRIVWRR